MGQVDGIDNDQVQGVHQDNHDKEGWIFQLPLGMNIIILMWSNNEKNYTIIVRSILGVEWCAGALRWGLGRLKSNSITHTDLHKPNNKLISV